MGSQDFSLRISDSFNVDDTHESIAAMKTATKHDDSVIVISDSSSESSPESSGKRKLESTSWRSRKNNCKSPLQIPNRYHLEYSDTDRESSPDEENLLFAISRSIQNRKCDNISNNLKYKQTSTFANRNVSLSSDNTLSDSDKSDSHKNASNKSGSTRVNPTKQFTVVSGHVSEKSDGINKPTTNYQEQFNYLSSSTSNCSSDSGPNYAVRSSSKKLNSLKSRLTKEDAHKIFKNIKSTRLVYESPIRRTEENVIINESIDEDIHPAVDNDKYIKAKINTGIRIINETISDDGNDNEVIPCSAEISPQVVKTPVNRITNTVKENRDVVLSERKKKEISHWIMANSPDSKSDSSLSHVTESNRNSISSGNSSLERLEMNYETPNNRGQIMKPNATEKTVRKEKSNQDICNSTLKQVTLHKFLQNTIQKMPEATPDRTLRNPVTPSVNTPRNVNIVDCASILDKLYGNEWRQKADALLPLTEPRKQNVMTRDRAVQTERKKVTKKVDDSTDSEEECFNQFVKNINPNLNSTKKQHTGRRKMLDSFINDESSSENDSDSLYHSALTNPRDKRLPTPKPVSAITKRVIEICDSDTDEEPQKENNKFTKNMGRRRLSFSDDDRGSITSEFDPGDVVPPKILPKKNKEEHLRAPRETFQIPARIEKPTTNNQRIERHKSFLASLSESVPLSEAHPDAKKYRVDYKNTREDLCKRLFKLYNEKIFDKKLPEDMSIEWNVRMRGTAGFCYNKRSLKTLSGVTRSSRIVLATKILDTPDRLRDTLVHEMCHAAAWLINDVSDGHGPFWKGWASKAMRTFPDLPPIRRCHDYKIKTKFTYKCTGCGYSIGRHSKSLDTERKRCGHCYGKFELLINKTTKAGTVQMQTPQREASGFALFVKENYSSVKKDRNVKHAEIMKILGQQFTALKIAKRQINVDENNTDSPF